MKKMILVILFLSSIPGYCQNTCDSTLFYQLFRISQQEYINQKDFLYSEKLVDSLSYRFCDEVIIMPDSIHTCLTYKFGQICVKANSEHAIKSFMKYKLKHFGSAEELISFTLENLFVSHPDIMLNEISKMDSAFQVVFLNDIIWGFVNNRTFGEIDPLRFNPFKAMTYYEKLPKPVLDKSNYIEIFYKVNPKIKELYNKYSKFYDFILNGIVNELKFQEERRKEMKY